MPNLPRLSQAPFISPTNNMLLIPCFMDEVHVVSYLVLSITSNCLQLPASVFKAISLLPPELDEIGTCSQRRASSSSLSSYRSEGAGNQRGEAYLQLASHYFCLLRSGRCTPDYMLVQQCQPSIEASRLLDWRPQDFPTDALVWCGTRPAQLPQVPDRSLGIHHCAPGPSVWLHWCEERGRTRVCQMRQQFTRVFSVSTESSQWDCYAANKMCLLKHTFLCFKGLYPTNS